MTPLTENSARNLLAVGCSNRAVQKCGVLAFFELYPQPYLCLISDI